MWTTAPLIHVGSSNSTVSCIKQNYIMNCLQLLQLISCVSKFTGRKTYLPMLCDKNEKKTPQRKSRLWNLTLSWRRSVGLWNLTLSWRKCLTEIRFLYDSDLRYERVKNFSCFKLCEWSLELRHKCINKNIFSRIHIICLKFVEKYEIVLTYSLLY